MEVTTLVAAMQADLTRPWRLVELAEIAHLSPSRLRQLFVEILGMPPIAWPTLQRVRAIARTISATDTTIRQAAAEVGWMNQALPQAHRAVTDRVSGCVPRSRRADESVVWACLLAQCWQLNSC